jgi:co-chaperonin GroES (HSP10)
MAMQFHPVGTNVLTLIEGAELEKTQSGVIIPPRKGQKRNVKVIAVGPDVRTVHVGDRLMFDSTASGVAVFENEGKQFVMLPESAVLAKITVTDEETESLPRQKKDVRSKLQRESEGDEHAERY